MYNGSKCCVINNGWFSVKTGVRQVCVMLGFLFYICCRKDSEGYNQNGEKKMA